MIERLTWKRLRTTKARELLVQILGTDDPPALAALEIKARTAALPFYEHWLLVEIRAVRKDIPEPADPIDIYALWRPDRAPLLLSGASDPIHAANEAEGLRLGDETGADYLRFFLFALRADGQPFVLFERAPAKVAPDDADAAALAAPLERIGARKDDQATLYRGSVVYQGAAFTAIFALPETGEVEMVSDEPVLADFPDDLLPAMPRLGDASELRARLVVDAATEVATRPAPEVAADGVGERPAIVAMAEMLLEAAFLDQSRNRLIEQFNARTSPAGGELDRLAALVSGTSPVIVVETTIPFIEETIARIVVQRMDASERPAIHGPSVTFLQGEEQPLEFSLPSSGPALVVIPLLVYRRAASVERLAFDIAARDLAAIVACERVEDLPESLRRIVDVVLTLPSIDPRLFEMLFERVMGAPVPSDWARGGVAWVKYVAHTDFEHPRRMRMSAREALAFIRSQVQDRLVTVDPYEGLGLRDLHGLGEARQFAEDLIADIHAAIAGDLDWSNVDRGALLVGPPGTGKTTLSRAIAKDCGIRFINASAAGWQAEGVSLGPHIEAIRRTFREARQFAPSILFIDEIDSLGNREQFAGSNNSVYQTEVVNAVLEQMSGLDPKAPVFVIGATNHEEGVDPALRRSGRLDRVIKIPRPNSEALVHIYRHHLKASGLAARDRKGIDLKAVAGMSVGLTGADVERIVRGAARRARKEGTALAQVHLLAEITDKPRAAGGSRSLTPQDLERVAVHEAGHALVAYLGPTKGADIGFLTVVPREDGKLGFLASVTDERPLLTRAEYESRIEICMGGRAAEEVRYGADLVSGGAHGDMRSASGIAYVMVSALGLGGLGRFIWSEPGSEADLPAAQAALDQAYQRAVTTIRKHEARLDVLVAELIAHQELAGRDVRAILSGRGREPLRGARGRTSR
jgi:AAA+ superfamily predicted ATPase